MKIKIQKRFIEERASRGLTMTELAAKAKITEGTISNAERGGSLSIKSAAKLCKALSLEFDQIFKLEA